MKKLLITQILLMIMFIAILQPIVYADSFGEVVVGIFKHGFGYFLQDETHLDTNVVIGNSAAINYSRKMTENVLKIVQYVGSVISVIALMIIGIRYMMSSMEEKAALKGVLIYYIIGAVLVFATSNILSIAYNIIFYL